MISSTSTTTATGSTPQAAAAPPLNPLGQLGKDAFLKLLSVQLQNQDPSNPMNNQDFMGQMAQFSSLEQTTNMAQGLTTMAMSQQISQSVGLIGHTIGYTKADGTSATGVAESVSVLDGEIHIKVGTESISPGDVTSVGALAPTGELVVIDPLQHIAPAGPAAPAAPAPARPQATTGPAFGDVLARKLGATKPLQFSGHALDRIRQRGIPVDEARIGAAVDRAAAKGSRTTLVLQDQAAFVVAAQNRTVITAVDREHMREQVFTNIDSAVLA